MIVCEAPVLPVTVECVSCSVLSAPHQVVSYTTPIILSGQCGQCDSLARVRVSANLAWLPNFQLTCEVVVKKKCKY